MIRKFSFGNPLSTEAVVVSQASENGELPFFNVEGNGESFTFRLGENDVVYGLGENVRGINKRGWIYVSSCSDDPNHREDKRSLYGAHNFLMIDGSECFAIFIDYPGKLSFDVGYTKLDELVITPADANLDFYVIQGEDKAGLVKSFRRLTGRSFIPPKWAFGYGQSRWSYMDEGEIREVVRKHRELGIPLDSIYMDIDYMERYKDFTVNQETFPDLPEFSREMREQGIHLVPIIDAGVKIEEGYDVYEEGVQNGYFCKEEDGTDFVAGVWPGRVHFPDMLNADARKWFGSKYKVLLDQGIDGFWNDMNEPAIFYSEKHLEEVFEQIGTFKGRNLDLQNFSEFQNLVGTVNNNPEDYKRFYHQMNGESVRHDRVHNLFGYNMTRAAGEAFEELKPDQRILMYSRSSYIGMHRYGGIWTGDNLSWWSHILLNLHMMPSLNMCGFLYTGADLGGFGADTTPDLMLRWLEFGIFTPLMRNHSAMGTRRQEVYRFEDTESYRNIIRLRYALLPYIYSEFMKAALRDEMYFKPLSFDYPEDDFAPQVEDQLLVGESIMVAPVYEQNAKGRYVYLPERMKLVWFRSMSDYTEEIMDKGHHYVAAALNEVLVFIRPDRLVPMSAGGQNVEDTDFGSLKVLGFVETQADYELYDDDGYGKGYENPANYSRICADKDGTLSICSQTGKTAEWSVC